MASESTEHPASAPTPPEIRSAVSRNDTEPDAGTASAHPTQPSDSNAQPAARLAEMADLTDLAVPDEPAAAPSPHPIGPAEPAVPIKAIIEAALLASNQPLTVAQLAALFEGSTAIDNDRIRKTLAELAEDCQTRGIELLEVASGFRFQVRRDIHAWVARLWTERQSRYSRALLETLALIAYRQPITRGEIERIRGVAVNSQIIKTLEEREWIRVVGHRDVPGKPELLGTTKTFLDYFGLKRLDELPPLAELRELTEIEPELPLDAPVPAAVSAPIAPPEPIADLAAADVTAGAAVADSTIDAPEPPVEAMIDSAPTDGPETPETPETDDHESPSNPGHVPEPTTRPVATDAAATQHEPT